MWDRRQNTSSSTAITAPDRRPSGGYNPADARQQRPMPQRHTRVVRPDGAYWASLDKNNILQPLDALGISNPEPKGPYRYAVQRGRIVPQRQHIDIDVVLPSQTEYGSARPAIVPPRRSSRRLQQKDRQRRNSARRPTSSIYSQSDGELSPPTPQYKLASSRKPGGSAALQISPPSSPDIGAVTDGVELGEVSPIDDDLNHAQQAALVGHRHDAQSLPSQQGKVSIPKPKQIGGQAQNAGGPPRCQDVQPSAERAWNSQVHTGSVPASAGNRAKTQQFPHGNPKYENSSTTKPIENNRINAASPSFGQRMRLVSKMKTTATDSRPPWHGASGRSAIVQPVRDDPAAAPLDVSKKGDRKAGRSRAPAPPTAETTGNHTGGSAMRRLLQVSSKSKAKGPSSQLDKEQPLWMGGSAYPSPPHDENQIHKVGSRDSDLHNLQNQPLGSHPPDSTPSSLSIIKRKPPPASLISSPAQRNRSPDTNLSAGASSPGRPPAHLPSDLRSEAAWVPPPSRFSVTTYATSNPGTPRQSGEGDLPPLPIPPPALSVMDRSRPISGARSRSSDSMQPVVIEISSPRTRTDESHHNHIDRLQAPQNRSVSNISSADRRASILSMSKPLPRAPPEMTSSDPVSQLDAQISGLFHRRVNIEKSIKQMTQLMPQDNLLASSQVIRKREEEKQKVDNLRQELAEILREEHELGLKLYRARKRRDKEAAFESTPLWVSRVAG